MNEETLKALTLLAEKLGTTVEYLWAILIRQAYLSFWIDIIYYVIIVALIYPTVKTAAKLWKYGDNNPSYDESELVYYLLSIILVIVTTIMILTSLCAIDDTITKLINPEYWALEQIGDLIK